MGAFLVGFTRQAPTPVPAFIFCVIVTNGLSVKICERVVNHKKCTSVVWYY